MERPLLVLNLVAHYAKMRYHGSANALLKVYKHTMYIAQGKSVLT
jgi:hypothetical protein